ncbi:MAG: TrbL/VirB6 family protein [Gammaproteobacteria bacterium]
MITANSFISDTLNTVDSVIGNFVNTAYTHFVQENSEVITVLFTVYVMFLGYQFLNHNHHFNLSAVTRHIVVMACVYGMIMNWQLYHLFVYNIFTNEPGNIAKILVSSAGKYHAAGNIVEALDGIYAAVINATMGFFGQVGLSASGVAFLFYGILVFIIGSVLCVFALLLFIYAKMMMAVALALGPMFIVFILWESTKGMFTSWVRTLITLAMIPVVTSAILVLMLSVINVTLPNVSLPPENLQFYGIAPFLGLSVATTLILTQVFRICSAFGGGLTLVSLSAGMAIASSSLQKTGIASAGRAAANWSQNKARQIKRRLM